MFFLCEMMHSLDVSTVFRSKHNAVLHPQTFLVIYFTHSFGAAWFFLSLFKKLNTWLNTLIQNNICCASSQEHLDFKLVGVVIFLRGSEPPNPLYHHCKQEYYAKDWRMANIIYTIIASQTVKIPGQMAGHLDKWSNSWTIQGNSGSLVGIYAIAYKNLKASHHHHQIVYVEAFFASLAWAKTCTCHTTLSFTQCCFGFW